MGENPLSPLVFSGIIIEYPYYIIVGLFIVSPLWGRKYIVIFGMGLLFMQRPYVLGFSYSFMAIMIAYLFVRHRQLNGHLAPACLFDVKLLS
jgi:hypothetical protein